MVTQSDLHFGFSAPDAPRLDIVRFDLHEGVSQPFRLALDLSSRDADIDATALLDREATFTIERAGTRARSPTPNPSQGLRVRSGQPCPYPAVWECLDTPIGRQTIAHGVPMPQVDGHDVTWEMVRMAVAMDFDR